LKRCAVSGTGTTEGFGTNHPKYLYFCPQEAPNTQIPLVFLNIFPRKTSSFSFPTSKILRNPSQL
jgi:hypothetical protein